VRNLVENAIVHTPAGTSVEVNLRDDGAIRVIDDGPGVAAAERSLIFQRFWRGRKKNRPGAGLGLSIVKRVVDAYDGTVEVADAAGGGAVFTISLPAAIYK
jgi:signal transduction histidine kinase